MNKPKVSKKEMLSILDNELIQTRAGMKLVREIKAKGLLDNWKRQLIVLCAIRALIEHGPEVSREFVEKYANRISIATTWNGQNVRILKRAFREAGVTVQE